MKKFFKNHFTALAVTSVLVLASMLNACGEKAQESNPPKTEFTDTVSVEAEVVKLSELNISRSFSGALEGEEQANIVSKIPERIVGIKVSVGEHIQAGTVMFELDKGGASSQFYQSQAVFLNAQKDYERMKNLFNEGAVSRQALDQTQTGFEVAKANFDAAKNTVEITSPISGVVTAINVNIGEIANPAIVMATVANISRMKAKFNVGESEVPSFYTGQQVQIYSEMNPDVIQSGKIFQLSKSANVQSRTFEMQAIFSNTNDRWFKPGMFCRVNVNLKTKKDARVIPLAAVVKSNNTNGVYLINDNKSYYKTITTGITDGKLIEVVSGLNVGDKIVTLGMNNLKDGTVVVISNN